MGGPRRIVTLDEVLASFEQLEDPTEPLTATEVADNVGCARRTAYNKLEALVDRDVLRTKKTGASSRVFWRPHGRPPSRAARKDVPSELTAAQALELGFRSETMAEPFLEAGGENVRITVEGIVHLSDGTHLQYWDASGISPKKLLEMNRYYPTNLGGQLLSTSEDMCRIEVHGSAESLLSTIEQFGGRTKMAVVKGKTIGIVVEFPLTIEVPAVEKSVKSVYPDLELVSERIVYTPTLVRYLVEEKLTDRQLIALEMAYYAGYFSSPRTSIGEELAEQLGVTKQTFHTHLRKAENAVFETLFKENEDSTDALHGG